MQIKKKNLILFIILILSLSLPIQADDNNQNELPLADNYSEIEYGGEIYLVENLDQFRKKTRTENQKTVGLALAGGGARAIANLGIVKALVENDIPIDLMTGTSMGSIISTLYGSGLSLEQIEGIVTDTPFARLFNFGGGALLNSKKANVFIESIAPTKRLENFVIPTAQLSFDLNEGKKYLATQGRISNLLQAAYSIPGYFPIHSRGEHHFMDAGILESTPAKSAALLGADFVIATKTPESEKDYDSDGVFQSANRFIEIIQQKYSGQIINRYTDFLIEADVRNYTFMDFNYAARLVEIGYQETLARMPELKKQLAAAGVNLVESKTRENYDLDNILRDLEFDRLVIEESGFKPLIYYGRDFSPFSQDLFRSSLDKFQLGAEFYYDNYRLSLLGADSWDNAYTASLRVKKLTDTLDLYFKFKENYNSDVKNNFETEIKYFGKRFNLSAGYGRRQEREYLLFGNDFRYLGSDFQWQSENDFFLRKEEKDLSLLTSQLINYDFSETWSIGAHLVYNNTDFVESPLIYRGQNLKKEIELQTSLNFKYNYKLPLPVQMLNFLQLTDIGGYLFVDYYQDSQLDCSGVAVGPAFNSRLYILGLKPIEVDLYAAHDFESEEQNYGLEFSYKF